MEMAHVFDGFERSLSFLSYDSLAPSMVSESGHIQHQIVCSFVIHGDRRISGYISCH